MHTVDIQALRPSGIRYSVNWPKNVTRAEVIAWCKDHFGPPGFTNRWMHLEYTIQFRQQEDRNWYVLKWS
jgi:hypothetical protein